MRNNTNKILNNRNKGSFAPVAKTDTQPLKSGKQNSNGIIMQIAKAFKDKSRKEIQTWRLSLLAVDLIENPRYNRYFDLVDDLKTDGTLKTQILLRKSATLSCGFQIRNRKTGAINELASELFQQKWFYKYLNIELDSILLGTRIVEFLEFNDHNIKFAVVPPRNTVPAEKKIFPDLSKDKVFIQYDDPIYKPWVIELNPDNPLGLINDIIPNLIWKRNVAQSWAEFCEKFGMPLISATTNNNNAAHIDKVEQQLLSMAEASVGVFPEGTTIKFDEANRTDAFNVYSKFIEHNSNEIAGVIVGSNTLSQNSANRSQTEVHERSLDYKISQSDRRDIAFNINDDLLPVLKIQGYSYISDDDIFEWIESKEEIDLVQYWSVVQGLMLEYDMDEEWLAKTFNAKIIGKKKSLNPTEPNKITALFKTPNYPKSSCCPEHNFPVASGSSKILDDLTNKLLEALWNNEDTVGLEGTMIVEEALQLTQGLKSGYGTIAGFNTPDSLAYQMMEYNLFEFSASKTEARLATMTELLIDKEKNEIRSEADFKKLANEKVKDLNQNYLTTEYNLSVAVGQNSAAYHRFLAEKDTVTSYVQYQTAGDSKVRNEHAKLDGKIFNLSDREAMKLFPPNGHGCRCEFTQYNQTPKSGEVMSGKVAQEMLNADNANWSKSQFNINRGDLKEVFTKSQFYSDIKGLPKKLNDMTFDKYDLPKWNSFKSDLNPISLDESITADNVKELFKKDKSGAFMGYVDYYGRKMIMTDKVFNFHTKGKYLKPEENRHQLFPHIKEILNKPDEVWYNTQDKQEGKFQSRYIKFYNDMVLVVDCEMAKDGLNIKTWYQAKKEDLNLRKGLLIRNKVN
jgi:SPP1 gp7 family putative phage head morphogenesis protein